jgi:hypothetical protein
VITTLTANPVRRFIARPPSHKVVGNEVAFTRWGSMTLRGRRRHAPSAGVFRSR